MKKVFKKLKLSELIPYENNPRLNDEAVKDVIESIKQCENLDPIEIDENNVILSGHTRLKALESLGYTDTEVIQITGLSDEQKRKYRLLANKTGEKADWDLAKLEEELQGLDFGGYDFEFDGFGSSEDEGPEEESIYTQKIDIPQYEPSDTVPKLSDCFDKDKYEELIEHIDGANISEEQKQFLRFAAARHLSFNYKKIADYYANADKEMQELIEESALVIIDYADAIKNGYAELRKTVTELLDNE